MTRIEGGVSARELERRKERDAAYRWICEGVCVNYHTLSDFHSKHAIALKKIVINSMAALVNQELIPLETNTQDGMRVRANAGKRSFRRKPTLENLQAQAKEHVEKLKRERIGD